MRSFSSSISRNDLVQTQESSCLDSTQIDGCLRGPNDKIDSQVDSRQAYPSEQQRLMTYQTWDGHVVGNQNNEMKGEVTFEGS